jgi:hypothetical protein
MNQVSCNKSLVRNVSSLTKHPSPACAHRIQRPHHAEAAPFGPVLPQKPDPQFFFFDKTLVICERPSDARTICDKILVLAFSSSPTPHHPEVASSSRILPQKPDPQCFFFDKTLVICERPSR